MKLAVGIIVVHFLVSKLTTSYRKALEKGSNMPKDFIFGKKYPNNQEKLALFQSNFMPISALHVTEIFRNSQLPHSCKAGE